MTYDQALEYIASLAPRGWRLGLDRMQAFIERAGLADSVGTGPGPQFVHVAGTNGKGSVTAYLQSIFCEAGYRTGAFFSPYVFDPRERVQLDRAPISKEDLAALTEELRPIAESFSDTNFGGITEFEFKTALGFLFWKRRRCEWVALEVGLGGRLDATNVVTPKSCVIVSIGLDHTAILGHTIQEIAFEKAGVIKTGVPVVVGSMPAEALAVIESVAHEVAAPLWLYGRDVVLERQGSFEYQVHTPAGTYSKLNPSLRGLWQPHNMSLGIAAYAAAGLSISQQKMIRAVSTAYAPGRLEERQWQGTTFLLDGAHNAEAADALASYLMATRTPAPQFVLITNMVAGHDPELFYRPLAPIIKSAHVVPIDFHRALHPDDVARVLGKMIEDVRAHSTLSDGIQAAMASCEPGDTILVSGSFYLVGEVGRLISASVS